jgi:hypothetical protein
VLTTKEVETIKEKEERRRKEKERTLYSPLSRFGIAGFSVLFSPA